MADRDDPRRGSGPDHRPVHVGHGSGRPLATDLLLMAALAVMHGGWEPPGLLGWVRSYLDDLVCLPVVLAGVLAALRIRHRRPDLTLPPAVGLAALVGFALYFEVVLPRLDQRATADVVDVLAYATGLLVFTFWINRPVAAPGPEEE